MLRFSVQARPIPASVEQDPILSGGLNDIREESAEDC